MGIDRGAARLGIEEVYRAESRRVLATPANPRSWLISTGRFKAIDRLRRRRREVTDEVDVPQELTESEDYDVADDRLRLIFTCWHPALTADAQVAMTLREVCGLTTEQVAAAFLTTAPLNRARALALAIEEPERRLIERRLREL